MQRNLNETQNAGQAVKAVVVVLILDAVFLMITTIIVFNTIDVNMKIKAPCGRSYYWVNQRAKRIANGNEVKDYKWPWMVYVECTVGMEVSKCGGTLIDFKYVLTAGHCVTSRNCEVYVGLLEAFYLGIPPQKIYKVEKVIIHNDSYINDIALLKLEKPVELSDQVFPICLPDFVNKVDILNKEVYVAGWGGSYMLKESILQVQNHEICNFR